MTGEPGTGPLDLTVCDREPIRVPGAIQPHGALLVIGAGNGVIRAASTNAATLLGVEDLLGRPLEECHPALAAIVAVPPEQSSALRPGRLPMGPGAAFDVFVRAGNDAGSVIVELEQSHDAPAASGANLRTDVTAVMATLTGAADVQNLLLRSCQLVAGFSGFERVMAYRFEPDGHGVVVAEVCREGREPFLGLHYPASDIPQQARELYLEQWLRIIPDALYQPVPIEAEPGHGEPAPLDLSECVLRAVSPVHLQYLANMGVRASMSVSLVVNGRLWGLLACHHYAGPRHLDHHERAACEFAGLATAAQIGIRESLERSQQKEARAGARTVLLERMAALDSIPDGLGAEPGALLALCDAAGAVVSFGGRTTHIGVTPAEPDVRELAAELSEKDGTGVLVSDRWAAEHPDHPGDPATMSGVVIISLARDRGNYLAWFRPEVSTTVTWAGRPDKAAGGSLGALSPRSSFAAWEEEVRGRSAAWASADIDAVLDLRSSIGTFLVGYTERLERLNRDLARSNEELDAFAYAAAHDLKEPLRGISHYAQFLTEDYEDILDDEGRSKLSTLVRLSRRMAALLDSLLDYSRAGRAPLQLETLPLSSVTEEVTEMLKTAIDETRATVTCTADGTMRADRAALREVLLNLVSNAVKYNDGDPVIEIRLDHHPETSWDGPAQEKTIPRISVSDNGIGIAAGQHAEIFHVFRRLHERDAYGGGTGVGLTIARRIVDRLGGSIWVESEVGRGSTFFFTLGGEQ